MWWWVGAGGVHASRARVIGVGGNRHDAAQAARERVGQQQGQKRGELGKAGYMSKNGLKREDDIEYLPHWKRQSR